MRYDPDSATLTVIFVSGLVYEYKNVPGDVYQSMKSSSSKGTFLNKFIKNHYEFRKV